MLDPEMKKRFAGKRLLILGGAVQCAKVVECASEMGIHTIVTDWAKDSPAKKTADEALDFSVMDADALIEWIEHNPVDGVLNYCIDYAQMAHQQICEHFAFPCFGTREQYRALNEKGRFKQLCRENGVDVIPDYTLEDVARGTVEYPVLVKPSDSSGSRGMTLCTCREEVAAAVAAAEKESKDGRAVIEKNMEGKQDFIVVYLFRNGRAHIVKTGDRYLGAKADGLERQAICTICPSRFSLEYVRQVSPRVVRMLTRLGIKNGPVFLQGFIDGDTVRFYDPGIRFPGGEYDRCLKKATGLDIVRMMICYALSGEIPEPETDIDSGYLLAGLSAVSLCIDAAPGEIGTYELDGAGRVEGMVQVAKKADVGSVIPPSGDVKQRVAEIILLAENNTETIKSRIREVQSLISVRNTRGENMLVSAMDPELLS